MTTTSRPGDAHTQLVARARAAEASYRSLFNGVLDAILVADGGGRYVDVNPAATELLGYTRDELLRMGIGDIVADGAAWAGSEFARFQRDGSWRGELELRRKDGTLVPVEARATKIEQPRGAVYVSVVRDISERRRSEELAAQARRQAEAAEREHRDKQALLHFTGEGIYGLDLNGRCTFINAAGAAMLGYAPDEMTGANMHRWVHYRRADGAPFPLEECPIYRAIRTGHEVRIEHDVLWRRDGTSFPVEYASFPVREHGRITGAVITFTDITRREHTEERLREEARLVEALRQVGIILAAELDLKRLVQAVTDAGTELTGAQFGAFFSGAGSEGGEPRTLYALSGAPRAAFARLPMPRGTELLGPVFRGEGVICLEDVTTDPRYGRNPPHRGVPPRHPPVRSYLGAPVVSRSGEVLGSLFFGHPEPGVFGEREVRLVTGIAAQAAIAIDNARLFQQSREALRVRDEFLSSASHELRTPLTSIKGYAQLLRRRAALIDSPERPRLISGLTSIERSTAKMAALVDELLDLSRLQAGRPIELHREPCNLVELVRRAAEEQRVMAPRHELVIKAEAPELTGSFDPGRLERVVANLLTNATKYSPEGGEVTISISRDHGEGGRGWAVLAVTDRGIGIPTPDQPRIFERFHRGANVGMIWGTGTGLAVSREIVQQHGGTVAVQSSEGAGTTVTIRLPLNEC